MKLRSLTCFSVLGFIAIFLLNVLSLQAQTVTTHYKCPPDCKCRINGECKCRENCKCAQVENTCRCSAKENKCKCKQSGDKSQCKCGDNCQCHAMGDRVRMDMGHNHPASVNPFLKMMDVMMIQMDSVPLTGSVEHDFLAQMIPHHQAAVEMAKYEIVNGKNFEMIQLAKNILAEQQGEIMDMNVMLKSYPAGNGTVNPAYKAAMDKTMEMMMKNTPTDAQLPDKVDCCFALVMLPHHQAAVDMAAAVLKFNPKSQVTIYAQRIIGDQQLEIEQMSEYINKNCNK